MAAQTRSSLVEISTIPNPPPSPPTLHIKESRVAPPHKSDSSMGFELQSTPPAAARQPPSTIDAQRPISLESPTPATPKTPSHLEQSRPSSPHQDRATEIVQSFWNPYMNRFRVVACSLMLIGNGLNDAAPGALLNYIETHYAIGYATVSTIFLGNALGFISAAFVTNALSSKVGHGRAFMIAEGLKLAGYVMLAATPPFPLVVISFFLCGLGMAINLAIGQVFILSLANSPFIQGAYQGSYGIGATVGPLIATALVSNGTLWSRFYLLTLGVAVFNLLFAGWSFWHHERDTASQLLPILEHISSQQRASGGTSFQGKSRWQTFKHVLFNRPTLLGSFFIFAYQGAEVSISGWVISFLVKYRNGDLDRVGYVTAGFWGGITLGRFALTNFAHRIGERNFIFAVTAGALLLEVLVWFVPSIPGDTVAVAFSGLALGPIYPCASYVLGQLIPRQMHVSSFSFIASIGSSGGALAPFLTGLSAQQVGTFVLHPICIGLFAAMEGCWFLLPRVSKRLE